MSWNYRVVRCDHGMINGERCITYSIREVYYDDAGKPNGWTEDPVDVSGESAEELRAMLMRMLAALDRPVLEMREEPGCG